MFGTVASAGVLAQARMGKGDDKFSLTLNGDLLGSARVTADVRGGQGADNLTLDARDDKANPLLNDLDIGASASVEVRMNGGKGDDSFNFRSGGILNGELVLRGSGEKGKDFVSATSGFKPFSHGSFDGTMLGGKGDDLMFFFLTELSPADVTIDALLDGGPGTDIGEASPGLVTKVNTEATAPE